MRLIISNDLDSKIEIGLHSFTSEADCKNDIELIPLTHPIKYIRKNSIIMCLDIIENINLKLKKTVFLNFKRWK